MKNFALFLLVLISCPPWLRAQTSGSPPAPAGGVRTSSRILTPTRQLVVFSDLENQLAAAIQKKDSTALDHMLSGDFELLTPVDANPLPREEFMQAVTSSLQLGSYQIRAMDVHAFTDTAVVNFIFSAKAQFEGKDRSGDYFIVDVWKKSGDNWQVAVRYLSKSSNTAASTGRRPTGKD